jgi:hypothetical protein
MPENHITIDTTHGTAVTINGHDVSTMLTSIKVSMSFLDISGFDGKPQLLMERPQVTLALSPRSLMVDAGAGVNLLDKATRALLEDIGWTPPDPNGQPKIPELWTRKEAAAHLDVTTERVRQMAEENPESFIVAAQSGGDERQIEFYLADPIRSFGEIPRKRGRKPKK